MTQPYQPVAAMFAQLESERATRTNLVNHIKMLENKIEDLQAEIDSNTKQKALEQDVATMIDNWLDIDYQCDTVTEDCLLFAKQLISFIQEEQKK